MEKEFGVPEVVFGIKERIVNADGLLLATPEYNSSIPGVLKNAIDWLSRPPDDIPRVFSDRPVGEGLTGMNAETGNYGLRISDCG